jgi:hypothetical protein
MHRVRIVLSALTLAIASAATAQTEGATTPTFHAGQWAARFQVANGFVGVGALHFSSPDRAWSLGGHLSGAYTNFGASDQTENSQELGLNVGRRRYRTGAARVRPFAGGGIIANFSRGHQVSGANDATDVGFGGGMYGELGATVFFAPELSLGAAWSANFSVNRFNHYQNGAAAGHQTTATLTGGAITLEGAFYF